MDGKLIFHVMWGRVGFGAVLAVGPCWSWGRGAVLAVGPCWPWGCVDQGAVFMGRVIKYLHGNFYCSRSYDSSLFVVQSLSMKSMKTIILPLLLPISKVYVDFP